MSTSPKSICRKRTSIPTFESYFAPSKKRKFETEGSKIPGLSKPNSENTFSQIPQLPSTRQVLQEQTDISNRPFSFAKPVSKKHFKPTVPVEPNLMTSQRAKERNTPETSIQESYTEFKARPKPVYPDPPSLIRGRPSTVPAPFNLSNSSRCHSSSESSSTSSFKARPAPDFSRPFTPSPSCHKPTRPQDTICYSSLRANQREQFNNYLKKTQQERETLRKKHLEDQMEIEAQEVKQLRKSLEFKARQMPKYPDYIPVKSEAPLTLPESPNLATKQRQRSKVIFGTISQDTEMQE